MLSHQCKLCVSAPVKMEVSGAVRMAVSPCLAQAGLFVKDELEATGRQFPFRWSESKLSER